MGGFFSELKRRHIYRVAAAYAVVAWVLLQLFNNLTPVMKLPDWAGTLVLVLLAGGFPVALIFAWIHDLKSPESGAAQRASAGLLDWALMGALIVVIALVSYQQLAPSRATVTAQGGVEAARLAAASPAGAISIAVLPFTNLSDDKQQEFFSDGITDELGTALAKIPDLRVVARQSAYRFKGDKQDARAIGMALSATHLIEGSVRKAGNRVRISAELVKADDGLRVWAENYDRDMTDVFAIQEDIAHAIAASLRMPLGLKPGEQLVNERTANPASHENYLRARNLVRQRLPDQVAQAITILNDIVAREPNYASAWGLLGAAYNFQLLTDTAVASGDVGTARPIVQANMAKGQAAAEQAIKLDPKNVDGYAALAELSQAAGDKLAAMDFFQRALAQDPDNPDVLQGYSTLLADLGFLKQALPVRDHLQTVEPFAPVFQGVTLRFRFASGQTDAVLAILEKQRPTTLLAQIYATQGRYREAADALEAAAKNIQVAAISNLIATAARLMRDAPKAAPANERPELGFMDWVYLYVGAPEQFLNLYEAGIKMGYQNGLIRGLEWVPAYTDIRKTESFKNYVRDAGMVAYWRAKGWPEQCHPTTGNDFECS